MTDASLITFQQVIDALLDESNPIKPNLLYHLSGLSPEEHQMLEKIWGDVPLQRRKSLFDDMEYFADADPLLLFDAIGRIGLKDIDPRVREIAIRLFWDTPFLDLTTVLHDMVEMDEDERVRAGAASAFGHYVYLGEIEEIPQKTLKTIEDQLLRTLNSSDHPLVRRRALEALGFSGRAEVRPHIEEAFTSGDDEWLTSALFAMGRSANPRWQANILEMLDHHNPLVRLEATRAAGELEIKKATPHLMALLDDADEGVFPAAVWSLSQISGEGVEAALEDLLLDNENENQVALLEEALENLAFTEDLQIFDLHDFSEDDLMNPMYESDDESEDHPN